MLLYLLIVAMGLIGVFGGIAAYVGVKAFKRNRDESLFLAATGFTLVTTGSLAGSIGCIFLGVDELTAHLTESVVVAVGLFSLVYSISRFSRFPSRVSSTYVEGVRHTRAKWSSSRPRTVHRTQESVDPAS